MKFKSDFEAKLEERNRLEAKKDMF